jgi:hypothetical protein
MRRRQGKDLVDCKTVSKKMVAFLDGELDAGWNSRIQQHLKVCKTCNKAAQFLSQFIYEDIFCGM